MEKPGKTKSVMKDVLLSSDVLSSIDNDGKVSFANASVPLGKKGGGGGGGGGGGCCCCCCCCCCGGGSASLEQMK